MNWFLICKTYYLAGYAGYDAEGLKLFVVKNKITQAQYDEIVALRPTASEADSVATSEV